MAAAISAGDLAEAMSRAKMPYFQGVFGSL